MQETTEEFIDLLESLFINIVMWKMAENGVIPADKTQYLDKIAITKDELGKFIEKENDVEEPAPQQP